MRAAVRTRYGPPDVVRVVEVEKPAAKDNEVLVRVHATTVNRTDCGLRAAKPFIYRFFLGLRRPRLTVLGNEFAGQVEAVGTGVRSFEVGDRVFGFSGSWFGAHAEYLTMPEDGLLATMPADLSYEEAAPSTEGSIYALSLIRTAKLQRGQGVLVNGATGAIGSAAVQLLRDRGAVVTAVCGAEHMELVRGLGADRVIDYTAEDFTRDERRYDVVMDAVGKSSFGRCRRLLKAGSISRPTWARCPRTRCWRWSRRCSVAGGSGSPFPGRIRGRSPTSRSASSPGRSSRSSTGAAGWTRSSRPTGTWRRAARSAAS
jgi:NADPH:quinone reductase-like Zn-dependent oxidoreductase